MTDYLLCKQLGLYIYISKEHPNTLAYDFVRASDLERLLSEAPVVYAREYDVVTANSIVERLADWCSRPEAGTNESSFRPWTHTARLINIQPIVKDSAESLLRELIQHHLNTEIGKDDFCAATENIAMRAQRLLGNK